MDESKSKNENRNAGKQRFDPQLLKKGLRCDLDQYDMLKRCSDRKDMTEWNEWRKENPEEEILLEGVDLIKANLDDINLSSVHLGNSKLRGSYLKHVDFENAHLENADLSLAHLDCTDLAEAHLEKSRLSHAFIRYSTFEKAHLEGSDMSNAHLEGATFNGANLTGAVLRDCDLQRANMKGSYLTKADLSHAHLVGSCINKAHMERMNLSHASLQGADLTGSDLNSACGCYSNIKGAKLSGTNLQGACFRWAVVDGSTLFMQCKIDCCTDFYGVGLGAARIGPETKQLLEYNIRRMNWEEWYNEHKRLKWLVKPFWLMSDYGLSTGRIVAAFFALAFGFAIIYYLCGRFAPPGIVDNLFSDRNEVAVAAWLVPLRTLYFSIVTMTTLGFGDMYANAHSILGHILLSVQVILGYVLLAALVTRFAVLFTAGGPAGKFADDKKNKIRNTKHEIRNKFK